MDANIPDANILAEKLLKTIKEHFGGKLDDPDHAITRYRVNTLTEAAAMSVGGLGALQAYEEHGVNVGALAERMAQVERLFSAMMRQTVAATLDAVDRGDMGRHAI